MRHAHFKKLYNCEKDLAAVAVFHCPRLRIVTRSSDISNPEGWQLFSSTPSAGVYAQLCAAITRFCGDVVVLLSVELEGGTSEISWIFFSNFLPYNF